jgi:hypothetical protein
VIASTSADSGCRVECLLGSTTHVIGSKRFALPEDPDGRVGPEVGLESGLRYGCNEAASGIRRISGSPPQGARHEPHVRPAPLVSTVLGHPSARITRNRYCHLFPGSEKEAAGLLDGYLERSVGGGSA